VGSEVFTEFYTGGTHVAAARYLYFGLHGHHELVPWIWTAIACNTLAAALLLSVERQGPDIWLIDLACALTLFGVWVEKGMGLIVPGFVPSTLHEIVPYAPSLLEWRVSAGVWALGSIIFTLGIKIAIAVFHDEIHAAEAAPGGEEGV
jgi:Ni/Fe-hydrogenase subunit HybB-like protein